MDEDIEYELQLTNTDDPNTVILVCVSSRPMTPDEYAEAIISYARRISVLADISTENAQ